MLGACRCINHQLCAHKPTHSRTWQVPQRQVRPHLLMAAGSHTPAGAPPKGAILAQRSLYSVWVQVHSCKESPTKDQCWPAAMRLVACTLNIAADAGTGGRGVLSTREQPLVELRWHWSNLSID
jgi:hypothetical protein